jgi:hypothetical protein
VGAGEMPVGAGVPASAGVTESLETWFLVIYILFWESLRLKSDATQTKPACAGFFAGFNEMG